MIYKNGEILYNEAVNSSEIGDKDIEKQGFDIGFGFKYYDYRNRFGYRYVTSKTTTDDTFTGTSISGEEGIEIETSLLNYSISSNDTDSFFKSNRRS